MKKNLIGMLLGFLFVGGIFVELKKQDTNNNEIQSETEVIINMQEQANDVYNENEGIRTEEQKQKDSKKQYNNENNVQIKTENQKETQDWHEIETENNLQVNREISETKAEDTQTKKTQTKVKEEDKAVAETQVKEKEEAREAVEVQAKVEEAKVADKARAKAKEEARAAAEAQALAEEEVKATAQNAIPSESIITEVNRRYIEDCGSDSGYWEITYSDGHVEYVEE